MSISKMVCSSETCNRLRDLCRQEITSSEQALRQVGEVYSLLSNRAQELDLFDYDIPESDTEEIVHLWTDLETFLTKVCGPRFMFRSTDINSKIKDAFIVIHERVKKTTFFQTLFIRFLALKKYELVLFLLEQALKSQMVLDLSKPYNKANLYKEIGCKVPPKNSDSDSYVTAFYLLCAQINSIKEGVGQQSDQGTLSKKVFQLFLELASKNRKTLGELSRPYDTETRVPAIFELVRGNQFELVKTFVEWEQKQISDPGQRSIACHSSLGSNIWYYTVCSKNLELLHYLAKHIDFDPSVTTTENYCLTQAFLHYGTFSMVSWMLKSEKFQINRRFPIATKAKNGSARGKEDDVWVTPLMYVINREKSAEVFKLLLDHPGISPENMESTIDLLVQEIIVPRKDGADKDGKVDGADKNCTDKDGKVDDKKISTSKIDRVKLLLSYVLLLQKYALSRYPSDEPQPDFFQKLDRYGNEYYDHWSKEYQDLEKGASERKKLAPILLDYLLFKTTH